MLLGNLGPLTFLQKISIIIRIELNEYGSLSAY